VAAVKALDAVFGADINPYAVAIARFRLTLSYLEKAGSGGLKDAPALPLHLVVADSLLHNPQHGAAGASSSSRASGGSSGREAFALEDEAGGGTCCIGGTRRWWGIRRTSPRRIRRSARRTGRCTVSAAGKYALSAPFCERFFQLARDRGYVGQITANSFMKREFGKKLIEEYLPTVNLELIVNTSGAYIPGHGTPTVLLFGTQEGRWGRCAAVLAKRGEPSTPENPAEGEGLVGAWSRTGEEIGYRG
jgi:hypothetical protein